MAESSWPDPAVARVVTDIQYEQLEQAGPGDGVAGSATQSPVVYADSTGRQVKIRANKLGKVRGHPWFSGPAEFTKAIGANATGQPRIDLVVLRLTRLTWAVTVEVRAGTPAAAPVPPAITQDADAALAGAGVFEVALATVAVAPGATQINAADVTTVAPYLGYPARPTLLTYDALLLLPSPTPGMTAMVSDQLYLYRVGNGWRRADWNASWGLLGGKEYTGNGLVTASGITSGTGEVLAGLDTGVVSFTPGRRYQFRVTNFQWQNSSAGAICSFAVRDNSIAGSYRGAHTRVSALPSVAVYDNLTSEWSETSGGSRTTVLSASTPGGSMTIQRSALATAPTGVEIIDVGPYTSLQAI